MKPEPYGRDGDTVLLVIIAVVFFILFVLFTVYMMLPDSLPAEERAWLETQRARCRASGSSGSYNQAEGKFECWNKPFMRRPKLTYTEYYR